MASYYRTSQINKSGFEVADIQNPNNVIPIPSGKGSIHEKISAYYSSKRSYTEGKTVRDWLAGKSFQEQFNFGLDVLRCKNDGR